MIRYNPFGSVPTAASPAPPPSTSQPSQSPPSAPPGTRNPASPSRKRGGGIHRGSRHEGSRPEANPQEALERAMRPISTGNYPAIIEGFVQRGIAASDIKPRENVFTYDAWRALGRQVRKGERSVRVTTWIPITKKEADPNTGELVEKVLHKRPHTAFVFHITQTDPVAQDGKPVLATQSPASATVTNAAPTTVPASPKVPQAMRPSWLERIRSARNATSSPSLCLATP